MVFLAGANVVRSIGIVFWILCSTILDALDRTLKMAYGLFTLDIKFLYLVVANLLSLPVEKAASGGLSM